MLQSLAILYAEHALSRKIQYDKIFIDFADKSPVDRRLCTVTGVVRSTGVLFRL